MKTLLALIIVFASYPVLSNQKGLPKHPDMTRLTLRDIPHTKEIYINAEVTIPNNHKTKNMPSALSVYEFIKGEWKKTSTLGTQQFLTFGNRMTISGKVSLQSENTPVAIDSTIYHCGKYCVINNFQGIVKRSLNSSSKTLLVKMKGYLPTDKIKKPNL